MSAGGRPADPVPPCPSWGDPLRAAEAPACFRLVTERRFFVSCLKTRLSSVDGITVSWSWGLVTAGRVFRMKPRTREPGQSPGSWG